MDRWVRGSRPSHIVGAALVLFVLCAVIPPPAEAAAATVVYHGSRQRPYVALTIDDGYNATNCRRIADILQARHVPATYFPYARVFRGSPATWRYISSRGFRVANHTVSHPTMTRLSYADQLWQITRAARIYRSVTGRTMAPLFRPPGGSYNFNTRRAAAAAGFRHLVLWDTSFADTASMSDAAHFRRAMRGTKGSIILLHCGPASSVRILPKVIAAYRARGLRFVTVEQMLGLPTSSPTPSVSPSPSPTPEVSVSPTPDVSPSPTPEVSVSPAPAVTPAPTPPPDEPPSPIPDASPPLDAPPAPTALASPALALPP